MQYLVFIFLLTASLSTFGQILTPRVVARPPEERRHSPVMEAITRRINLGVNIETANQAPANNALQICQYREANEMTVPALELEHIITSVANTIPQMRDDITFGNTVPYNLKNCYEHALVEMRRLQEILNAHPQIAQDPNPFELTERINEILQRFMFAARPLPNPDLYYVPGQYFLPHETQTRLLIGLIDKFQKFLSCTRPLIREHRAQQAQRETQVEDAERHSIPEQEDQDTSERSQTTPGGSETR